MEPQQEKISLFPILLVTFIGTLGFSIVLPFLVVLVTKFGGNAVIYGLVGAAYSASQLIGAPILGRWSDKYGRKKILLFSQIGTLIAWVIFLVALFLPRTTLFVNDSALLGTFTLTVPLLLIVIARALDGVTGGNVSVANAYLADITKEKERSKNFGKMGVASNLGFIIGPALAGLLGATVFGATLPVVAALVISVVAVFVIASRLKESRPCVIKKDPEDINIRKILGHDPKECYLIPKSEKVTLKQILRIKHIPYLLVVYFVMFLGFNVFYTAFPIHAIQGLGWSIVQMGMFFALMSFVLVLVQGPVLSRASKKYSDASLCIAGNAVLGTSFLFLLSSNVIFLYGAAVLFAVGNGLMWPSFLSILSKHAGEKHQGSVQGFASSSGSLASIIGLILGGFLYVLIGPKTFLISAGAIYIVFLLSFRFLSFQKKTT